MMDDHSHYVKIKHGLCPNDIFRVRSGWVIKNHKPGDLLGHVALEIKIWILSLLSAFSQPVVVLRLKQSYLQQAQICLQRILILGFHKVTCPFPLKCRNVMNLQHHPTVIWKNYSGKLQAWIGIFKESFSKPTHWGNWFAVIILSEPDFWK